jgi:hypothetical protein
MIGRPFSQYRTSDNNPLIPRVTSQCGREGKRTALAAVFKGWRNAIAAPRQPSSPTPEQPSRR